MFMKPSELRASLAGSVDLGAKPLPDDWDYKSNDSLKNDIKRKGVQTPVIVDHGYHPGVRDEGGGVMGNGHHRVHNAHRLEEEGHEIYVPIVHTDGNYMGSDLGRSYPGVVTASMTNWDGPTASQDTSSDSYRYGGYRSYEKTNGSD